MILVNKLKGMLVEKGISVVDVAKRIGESPVSLYRHLDRGVLSSSEIEVFIELLDIAEPMSIFFAK